MNKQFYRLLDEASARCGFTADATAETAFGIKNGYEILLHTIGDTKRFAFTVSVSRAGEAPALPQVKQMIASSKLLTNCTAIGSKITFEIKFPPLSTKKLLEYIPPAIEEATALLRQNGYENCCQHCGAAQPTDACVVFGATSLLCPNCFASASQSADVNQQAELKKEENDLTGIVGALIGSLLGVAAIVILGQLGYVAAISGIIMAVCVLKGYELLGHRISTKSVIFCCIIMALMVFAGNQIDWAITIASYFEVDFFSAFRSVFLLIEEDYIDAATFYQNVALLYVFTAVGAIPTIINQMKAKKKMHLTYKLGSNHVAG